MRRGNTDRNQAEIVDKLRKVGATVTPTHMVGCGFPDIVVGFRGRNHLLEIKNGERWKFTDAELDWHQEWKGDARVVTDADQAIAIIQE